MQAAQLHRSVEGFRRIVLTGFMGSGKTTVGRILAANLGWRFADLDSSIEERLGIPLPRIFAELGEARFRAAELDALLELINGSRLVIALGGGAPEAPGLRDLLACAPETAVVYLQAEFDPLYRRCLAQAQDPHATPRPVLGSEETARVRFERRRASYEALATHTVQAHPGSPAEVARTIATTLSSQLPGS